MRENIFSLSTSTVSSRKSFFAMLISLFMGLFVLVSLAGAQGPSAGGNGQQGGFPGGPGGPGMMMGGPGMMGGGPGMMLRPYISKLRALAKQSGKKHPDLKSKIEEIIGDFQEAEEAMSDGFEGVPGEDFFTTWLGQIADNRDEMLALKNVKAGSKKDQRVRDNIINGVVKVLNQLERNLNEMKVLALTGENIMEEMTTKGIKFGSEIMEKGRSMAEQGFTKEKERMEKGFSDQGGGGFGHGMFGGFGGFGGGGGPMFGGPQGGGHFGPPGFGPGGFGGPGGPMFGGMGMPGGQGGFPGGHPSDDQIRQFMPGVSLDQAKQWMGGGFPGQGATGGQFPGFGLGGSTGIGGRPSPEQCMEIAKTGNSNLLLQSGCQNQQPSSQPVPVSQPAPTVPTAPVAPIAPTTPIDQPLPVAPTVAPPVAPLPTTGSLFQTLRSFLTAMLLSSF